MSYTDLLTEENFGVYGLMEKKPLTEEEKASTPFALFYDLPIQLPSEENIMALLPGHEVDSAKTISPAECKKLFTTQELECENGYCLRPEGCGFSAVNIKMPRVTPEMLAWWFTWYPKNPVHYMIWLPGFHVNSSIGSVACEDLGWGVAGLDRQAGPPIGLDTFGIEDPKALDPDYVRFFGGNMHILKEDGSDKDNPPYLTMVNYIRRYGDGIEFKVRCWMGAQYINGEIILEKCDHPVSLLERTRLMACHNAWEWSRMSELLPEIYAFAQEKNLL
ncbi:MAG: hypothetical protein LIO56_07375 [Lachnospiraceae bacterium]|nr:hypothetical protein [Lachnospiraceae bacterium]